MAKITQTSEHTYTAVSGSTIYLAVVDRGIFGNNETIEIKEADFGTPVATIYHSTIVDDGWYQIHFVNESRDVVSSERQSLPTDLCFDAYSAQNVINWICDARESQCFVDLCPVEDESYV